MDIPSSTAVAGTEAYQGRGSGTELRMERAWAMSSPWTFTIPPIKRLLGQELCSLVDIANPFAGLSSPASVTNDLNPDYPTDFADLLDPPYSPRQAIGATGGSAGSLPPRSPGAGTRAR